MEDNLNNQEDPNKDGIQTNKVRKTITINGVDIAEYQKKLETLKTKTTPAKKKINHKKASKTKKTEQSNTNTQKITKFLSTDCIYSRSRCATH